MTLADKVHVLYANAVSVLRHRVAEPGARRHLWGYGLLTAAVVGLLLLGRLDYQRGVEIGPQRGPHELETLQEAKRLKLKQKAWEDAQGKPLRCPPVYIPATEKEARKVRAELPGNVRLWEPGTPMPLDLKPGEIAAAIAATGRIKRGECPYGCDAFALRAADGSSEWLTVNPDNPRLAWENNWDAFAGGAYSAKFGAGAVATFYWEPVSFRLGKLPLRLYPRLGAQGLLFSGQTDAAVTGGLALHRPH